MEKTLGEKRVRTDFNITGSTGVDLFKSTSAQMINALQALPVDPLYNEFEKGEFFRLKALAMTAYEEAAMWAVKAATI